MVLVPARTTSTQGVHAHTHTHMLRSCTLLSHRRQTKSLYGAAGKLPKSGKPMELLTGLADANALAQAAMELLAEPSLAVPQLPPSGEQGSDDKGRTLPPAPPPPQRGSVLPVPEPLQRLFPGGGGGSDGTSGVLQRLLSQALESLDTSCTLGAGQPDSAGQQLPLRVSPDIDFGTVAVSRLEGEQLLQAAASVAAGLPSSHGIARSHAGSERVASQAGSLLDLLHLSSQQQRSQGKAASLQSSSAPAGAGSTAGRGTAPSQGSPGGSVLHFRQLLVENTSPAEPLWLLGGIAAPAFPHTLAAVDDARLFWLEGGRDRQGGGGPGR